MASSSQGKSREIMLSRQGATGFPHCLEIDLRIHSQRKRTIEGRQYLPPRHAIAIELAESVLASMKSVGHFFRRQHPDILGKMVVGTVNESPIGEVQRPIDVSNLSSGMDSRIGSTCAHDVQLLPCKSGQCLLDHLLDRQRVVLALPASIGRTTVGKSQSANHLRSSACITKNGAQIAQNTVG